MILLKIDSINSTRQRRVLTRSDDYEIRWIKKEIYLTDEISVRTWKERDRRKESEGNTATNRNAWEPPLDPANRWTWCVTRDANHAHRKTRQPPPPFPWSSILLPFLSVSCQLVVQGEQTYLAEVLQSRPDDDNVGNDDDGDADDDQALFVGGTEWNRV